MNQTSSKIGVQILLEAFLHHGIEDVVFSPGSRNAPLVIGLVGSSKFRSICIHDERSAAFYALGMALVSGKPVPVICTSGSALLNFSPAVAEAYYQRIPYLVISADRPLEWIDQGDGQTIRQIGVYSNFIDFQISFPAEAQTDGDKFQYNNAIQKAMAFAKYGPVHINMPFSEPLYDLIDFSPLNLPQSEELRITQILTEEDFKRLKSKWLTFEKRMILVGQLKPNHGLDNVLSFFAKDTKTAVLSENTSNLEIEEIIPCIDRTLATFDPSEVLFQPECLIVIGGAVVSKKIKSFLRAANLQMVWRIDEDFPAMDTYQRLDQSFAMNPKQFLEGLSNKFSEPHAPVRSTHFGDRWIQNFQNTQKAHERFLSNVEFCDLKVIALIFELLPNHSILHLGNSSIIRYAQLFADKKQLNYYCNRGTSGIDGSVSTAVGAALKYSQQMHTLIIGDVSFFYDSNALWSNFLPENLRIVMIHNGGGGIFEIIPGPNESSFRDDFFVAKHSFSAEHLCNAFNVSYVKADNFESLKSALEKFYTPSVNDRPKFLEVDTMLSENASVLRSYFQYLRVESNR
jgi:2-succinyl-5-enolpyruvyl-6-hydroxy-3-cyclohexene-1-carboxylate synthase